MWNLTGTCFLFVTLFACVALGGPPSPVLTLSQNESSNEFSLGWLASTENTITYQSVMNVPSVVNIAATGHILTPKNSSSVFIPSYEGNTTTIYACDIKTMRCAAEATIPLSIVSLSYDTRTKQLWFVGTEQTGVSFQAGFVMPSVTSPNTPPTILVSQNSGNDATFSKVEAALTIRTYDISYQQTNMPNNVFGQSINRTNHQVLPVVTFVQKAGSSAPYLPGSIVFNQISLTAITSLCADTSVVTRYQTCSPNYATGTSILPQKGDVWSGITPTGMATEEYGGFANYYYTIVSASSEQFLWVLNAADGWTISNNTLSSLSKLNGSTIWGITTLETA